MELELPPTVRFNKKASSASMSAKPSEDSIVTSEPWSGHPAFPTGMSVPWDGIEAEEDGVDPIWMLSETLPLLMDGTGLR